MYDEAFEEDLTTKDIISLLHLVQNGNRKALEEIIVRNTPLVRSAVKHFLCRGYEFDDLFQIGTIGLIKAARNYDFSYEVKFSTYAVPLIIGEIKRFLRDDGMIKISRTVKENAKAVNAAKEKLYYKLFREPTVTEIADETALSYEDVIEALGSSSPVSSLDEPVSDCDNSDMTLADKIGDEKSMEDEVGRKLFLSELLSGLNEEERNIIVLRYFNGMTQTAVAQRLGLSQVQVSRKEKRILTEFRRQCG